MKRCPSCNRVENDEALKFCRVDGATLTSDSSSFGSEAGTAQLDCALASTEIETSILPHATDANINRETARTTVLPAGPPITTGALAKPKRRKTAIAIVVTATAIFAAVSAATLNSYLSRSRTTAIDSIAVLPFENRSGSADTDYLSDGVAESLIYRLSQLPNLKVSPTSSVMRYKGKGGDLKAIANDLGVGALMTGHLVQRGDNLTISVELVDVRNNKLLWGEQYDRKMADLLATQREIAASIAQKLQIKLAGNETKGIAKHYTDNNEAYQLYLKGRFYFARRTEADIRRSIELYQQAIKLDPNFALAYVGVAEAYNTMPSYPYAAPNQVNPLAKEAANKALEIDPDL